MGISAEQFWNQSQNGRDMMLLLVRNASQNKGDIDPETIRGICDWLVDQFYIDQRDTVLRSGGSRQQAELVAHNNTEGLRAKVDSIGDRNLDPVVIEIVDACFRKHFNHGQQSYMQAMAWFANQLRARLRD